MPGHIGRLLFPNDRGAARGRKTQILCITLVLGLAASAFVGYLVFWAYSSGRF
jgi:hypothetical protein